MCRQLFPISVWCLYVARQFCGTPCRFIRDMSTLSKLVLRCFHGVSYTLYVISSKVSSSILSTGFSSIYVSEFVSTYALTTKHMTWLNIEIFCFKLLHHIKSDPFRSLSFLFMNHQYTAALGCMLLKDVTKYLFVVQTNSHIFTMMSYFHHIFSNRPACHK